MGAVTDVALQGRELLSHQALHRQLGGLANLDLGARRLAAADADAVGALADLREHLAITPGEAQRHDGDHAEDLLGYVHHEVALPRLDLRLQLLHAMLLEDVAVPLVLARQNLQRAKGQHGARVQRHGRHDALVLHRDLQVGKVAGVLLRQDLQHARAVVPHEVDQLRVSRKDFRQGLRQHREHLRGPRRVQPAAVQPVRQERHLAKPRAFSDCLLVLRSSDVLLPGRRQLRALSGRLVRWALPPLLSGGHVLKPAIGDIVDALGLRAGLEDAGARRMRCVPQGVKADVFDHVVVHCAAGVDEDVGRQARLVDVVPELRAHHGREQGERGHVPLGEPLRCRHPLGDLLHDGKRQPGLDPVLVQELPQLLQFVVLLLVGLLVLHHGRQEGGYEHAAEDEAEDDEEDRDEHLPRGPGRHDAPASDHGGRGPIEADQVVEGSAVLRDLGKVPVQVPMNASLLPCNVPQATSDVVHPHDVEDQLDHP
mmetsp:Transcript_83930/g.264987  ORF Transcript_83930/g.264987 Transcript_83930/m.264987 type:complete len:483 (+) Transcript_83930:546-1994(+)